MWVSLPSFLKESSEPARRLRLCIGCKAASGRLPRSFRNGGSARLLPGQAAVAHAEGEVYAQADRVVECTNWFMHQLTGRWTLSLNHVAVKWNYARPEGGWSDAAFQRFE